MAQNKSTLWRISSDFEFNTVVARKAGLDPELCYTRDSESDLIVVTGSYRQCIALASQLRWDWISSNGFNAVMIKREPNRVVYFIRAHFGMPAYGLCKIERLNV